MVKNQESVKAQTTLVQLLVAHNYEVLLEIIETEIFQQIIINSSLNQAKFTIKFVYKLKYVLLA